MTYPVSAPFAFTDVPDFVFDQILTFATMNILLNDLRNIGSAFEVEHTLSSGLHNIVSASYKFTKGGSANLVLSSGAYEIIDFDEKIFDDYGADRVTTGAAWKFTADRDMKLRVSARVELEYTSSVWNIGDTAMLFLDQRDSGGTVVTNGVRRLDYKSGEATSVIDTAISVQGSAIIEMSSGDYFSIRAYQDAIANWPIDDVATAMSVDWLCTYIDINEFFPGV